MPVDVLVRGGTVVGSGSCPSRPEIGARLPVTVAEHRDLDIRWRLGSHDHLCIGRHRFWQIRLMTDGDQMMAWGSARSALRAPPMTPPCLAPRIGTAIPVHFRTFGGFSQASGAPILDPVGRLT